MSLSFYLACDECKERTPLATRWMTGVCALDASESIAPFVLAHHHHHQRMRVLSEHEIDDYKLMVIE